MRSFRGRAAAEQGGRVRLEEHRPSRAELRRAKNARRRERRERRESARRWKRWLSAIDIEHILYSEDWQYRALRRKYGHAGATWRIAVVVAWGALVVVLLCALIYKRFA